MREWEYERMREWGNEGMRGSANEGMTTRRSISDGGGELRI